jgi:hypothetical protein
MVKTAFFPSSLATVMLPPQRSTNAFTDRQAQPHARLSIGASAKERQKDTRDIFRWYSDSGVGNMDHNHRSIACFNLNTNHTALFHGVHGVVQQVDKNLAQFSVVTLYPDRMLGDA